MVDFIVSWTNAPFLLALFVAFLLMVVSIFGVISDVHGGIDLNGDGVAEIHLDGKDTIYLTWFGFGKAPASILFVALLLGGGVGGMFLNALWPANVRPWLFPITCLIAALGGMASVRLVAAVLTSILPAGDTDALQEGRYVGRIGIATHTFMPGVVGQIRIDETPSVGVIAVAMAHETIPIGRTVIVQSYDSTAKLYFILPYKESA